MTSSRWWVATLAALWAFVACTSHPKRIDCEDHLQPINAPAPVSKLKAPQP